jgi:hypothetical protein
MEWTIEGVTDANHNPQVVVNGRAGRAPLLIDATVGSPLVLDASGTRDPDGDAVTYGWFFYPEAGTGIPGQPVATGPPPGAGGTLAEGGIPSAPGGLPEVPPRVTLQNAASSRVTVTPRVPGTAHVILAVEDDGRPSLTSYRRVILTIRRER